MAQIQVRIDDAIKLQAQDILQELGINLTTAIKMLCTQIIQLKALPLQRRDINGNSLEEKGDELIIEQSKIS